jgi:hypothetical protein
MSEAQRIIVESLPKYASEVPAASLSELIRALWPSGAESVPSNLQAIAVQLEQVRPLSQQQAAALAENTQAVVQNTAERAGQGGVAAVVTEHAKNFATTILKGITLSPLISGLVSWIKGSKAEEPPPLVRYEWPERLKLQAGLSGAGGTTVSEIDYDDSGQPRVVAPAASYAVPPITVQVQALDSRSFLDHSEEIARAVREALLNAHALGDTIREL